MWKISERNDDTLKDFLREGYQFVLLTTWQPCFGQEERSSWGPQLLFIPSTLSITSYRVSTEYLSFNQYFNGKHIAKLYRTEKKSTKHNGNNLKELVTTQRERAASVTGGQYRVDIRNISPKGRGGNLNQWRQSKPLNKNIPIPSKWVYTLHRNLIKIQMKYFKIWPSNY